MFLFEAISDFLLEQRFRGNSKATVSDYQTKLSKFQVYADFGFEISDLTLNFIRSYYYHLSNTLDNSITIQSYVRALRATLRCVTPFFRAPIFTGVPPPQFSVCQSLSFPTSCAHAPRQLTLASSMVSAPILFREISV